MLTSLQAQNENMELRLKTAGRENVIKEIKL